MPPKLADKMSAPHFQTGSNSTAALAVMLIVFVFCFASTSQAAESSERKQPGKLTSLLLHVQTPSESEPAQTLHLRGADARQQLLVTAKFDTGEVRDFTRQVSYETSPSGIVQIDKTGRATPVADGTATITAKSKDGLLATTTVIVEQSGKVTPVNFPNQIVPIFTKTGCNAGGCHGKSSGQNGFRLSLLGFEPTEDYEHLVKEARGRRLFPAAPDRSLLLLKGTAAMPHGGGKRLEPDSDDSLLGGFQECHGKTTIRPSRR
jgi:hypothetical protein